MKRYPNSYAKRHAVKSNSKQATLCVYLQQRRLRRPHAVQHGGVPVALECACARWTRPGGLMYTEGSERQVVGTGRGVSRLQGLSRLCICVGVWMGYR